MGDAWSGNSGMDPYAALEPTWSGLGNYGLSSGVQARPQQHRGYGTAGAGQAAGPSNATLPELDDDFIDCLLANLQVPALPQQQLHNQGQQQQQQQQQRAPDQQQLRHLHVLPSALGAATGEAERADPESEARYTMASSDDIEPTPTIARLKERNRKAQRAFRARQKEKSSQMSKTVKELSDQLNTLAVQHEQLLQRNKLLEMALGSTPVDQRSQPGSVELQREDVGNLRFAGSQPQGGAKPKLEHQPSVASADSQTSTTEVLQPQSYFAPDDSEQDVTEFVLDCGRDKYTITDAWLRSVQFPEFTKVMLSLNTHMSDLLRDPTCKNTSSPTGKMLEDFLKVSLRLMGRLSLFNWRLKHTWLTQPHVYPPVFPPPQRVSWETVKGLMQLEPWQEQEILRLHAEFWQLQNSVLTERQGVEASLQHTATTAKASTLAELSERHVQLHFQAQQLGKLWQRTYAHIGVLVRVCWIKVLKPWQAAAFATAAFPYAADSLWMAEMLARDHGLHPGQPGLLETRFDSATLLT